MPKDARLIINSMGKTDLHIHTNFSDGITKPSDVLKLAKSRGLAVIAITDHNTIEGAQEVKKYEKESGVEVIIGEEVSTIAGHIAGLFLQKVIPRGFDPADTIKAIHRQGGIAVIAHPLAQFPKSVNLAALDYLVNHNDLNCRPDAVEVLNGFPWNFRRSSQLLSMNNEWKLAITGGSDSHGPRSLGCAYTLFEGNSSIDLRKALAHKTTTVHGHAMPMVEWVRTVGNDALYRSRKVLNSQSTRSSSSPH